jgi:ComF family protein
MNLVAAIKPFGLAVLNTLLPPHCLACDAPVDADGKFCLPCFRRANFITAPFCARCGVPLPFAAAAGSAGDCDKCEADPPAFGQARAALRYDELAKKLILPFKYADRPEVARGISLLMARAGAPLLAQAELLIPVPLHKSRLRHRRYNQSVLLAVALGRSHGLTVARDALVRHKSTLPLAGMDLAARRAELDGAITIRPGRATLVQGRRILLIDDIMTSGATANACATALAAAGAVAVNVLTATRVADPRFE